MTTRYGVIIDGKRGAYGVVFPDLLGCTAMGKTIDAALRNAAAAAGDWVAAVRADDGAIPAPRSLEELRRDTEVIEDLAAGGTLAIVPVVLDYGRPTKANLSLDAGLLAAIDEAAKARGLTRSAYIASAVREKMLEDA